MFTLTLELLAHVPTYTYTCTACNDVIEKRQSFSDAPLTTCEQCGGALRKVIHPVGIVFKGSGWYSTDSRAASSASTSTSTSGNGRKESDSGTKTSSEGGSSEGGSSKESSSSKDAAASTGSPSTSTSSTSSTSGAKSGESGS